LKGAKKGETERQGRSIGEVKGNFKKQKDKGAEKGGDQMRRTALPKKAGSPSMGEGKKARKREGGAVSKKKERHGNATPNRGCWTKGSEKAIKIREKC